MTTYINKKTAHFIQISRFDRPMSQRKNTKMIRYKPNKTLLPQTPADANDKNFQWELDPTIITWDGGNGTSSAWHLVDGDLNYWLYMDSKEVIAHRFTIGLNVS